MVTFLFVAASIARFHFVRLIIIASFAPVSVASQGRGPTPAFRRGIDRDGAAERSTNVAPAAERVGSPSKHEVS